MAKGFEINKQGIARMMRDLQREVDKHPIKARVQPEPRDPSHGDVWIAEPPAPVTNYNGPVVLVSGDGAQVAVAGGSVTQSRSDSVTVAAPYGPLAAMIAEALENLPSIDLSTDDLADAQAAAEDVLREVVRDEPDPGVVRRGVAAVKGYLASVLVDAGEETGSEVVAWAAGAVSALGSALG